MDEQTIKFYEKEALNLAGVYDACDGGVAEYLSASFSSQMHILEVGCGSGRDLARLVEMGFDGFCIQTVLCQTIMQLRQVSINIEG